MDINKLARKIHANNKKKGFWDKKRNEGEVLMLVITELSEMLEADRKEKQKSANCIQLFQINLARADKFKYSKKEKLNIKRQFFEQDVKDSRGDELADAFIRLCDYFVGFKVNFDQSKMQEIKDCKFNNLGESLLDICGDIKFLHRGVVKELSLRVIFSKLIWIADQLSIPLEKHIEYKMWYNSTRSKMHGKKY